MSSRPSSFGLRLPLAVLLRAAGFSFEAGCLSDLGSSVCPMMIWTQSTDRMASVEFASRAASHHDYSYHCYFGGCCWLWYRTNRHQRNTALHQYCSILKIDRGSYAVVLSCWPRYPRTLGSSIDTILSTPQKVRKHTLGQKTIKLFLKTQSIGIFYYYKFGRSKHLYFLSVHGNFG